MNMKKIGFGDQSRSQMSPASSHCKGFPFAFGVEQPTHELGGLKPLPIGGRRGIQDTRLVPSVCL